MYLGVDLGTSSLKVLLSDGDGKIVATTCRGYRLLMPRAGWTEQNPEDWYNALLECIKELKKSVDLREIEGVSFCGQMHGLVLLGENDEVLRPAILWNDNRTVKECAYLNDVIGKDALIGHTGNICYTGFTAPKILWVKNNEPQIFCRIKKIMLPKDYLAYAMSGVFASDVSDNSGTLYFDVKNKKWSKFMLSVLGIYESQLPSVYESYDCIGTVCPEFAKRCGLSERTKVIIGGGDQAVGAIGTGTTEDGALSISLGTSGVVFSSSDNFVEDKLSKAHSFCHANGKFHTMGVMLSAAGSLDWWVKNVLKTDNFSVVLKEAENADTDGLYFLPYLSGERCPINNPEAKGVFYGLTLMKDRGCMTRAIIEGVCLGLYDCLLALRDEKIGGCARVIGGGAKSELFLQTLADVTGLKISTINSVEGGGYGAVILAMVGCGAFKDVNCACRKLIREEKAYFPDISKSAYYNDKYLKFKRLYTSLIDL